MKGRLTVLAAISGLLVAFAATAADAPAQPLITDPAYLGPVQMVDIGGRHLNLYCRGKGSPVVIFDSGLNDTTIAWARVQPEISKTHMTCSYDRAGLGFSDASGRPSTAGNDVDDIHKALQVAKIKPPYLLVAHSAAGLAVRVFADRYRDEVIGMVIVDGSHEDQVPRAKARAALEAKALPKQPHHKPEPEPNCVAAAKSGEIPKSSPAYKPCIGEMYPGVDQAITDATFNATAKLKWQKAFASEETNFATVSADEARATRHDFGDMPIIMLTSAPYPARKGFPQALQDGRTMEWEGFHNEVAAMSTHGVNWIVPRSTHIIAYDRPEIVVDAIHQALAIAASPGPKLVAKEDRIYPIVTDPVYTGPARLVDVGGGRHINLYCRGTGSPTVVFASGALDTTIAWAMVQPTISEKHQTCSFDRAGLGFSDAAIRPGTSANEADDLHRALQAAHIAPPYVLVGHSAAGLSTRIFADRFRDEVVGLVIVDGVHEDQARRLYTIALPDAKLHWYDEVNETTCVDALKSGEIPKTSTVYDQCVGHPDKRFTPAINDAQLGYEAKAKYQEATRSETKNFWWASSDETRATRRDFGDMPIVYLTHAPYKPVAGVTQLLQDQRTAMIEQMHNEVAAMSTHGINEIVPRSGHIINYDRPEIVIDAINQVLAITAEQAEPSRAVSATSKSP